MPNFSVRDLSEIEQWVSNYEAFVESIRDGYDMCIHEYTNDLACRGLLEDHRDTPNAQAVWPRVIAVDTAFQAFLLPTKRSIYGDAPPSHFWYWGYPSGSPELEADLRAMKAI